MLSEVKKRTIALYASPKCRDSKQMLRYKSYFNVAWFVRAYSSVLENYEVLITEETKEAVENAADNDSTIIRSHWLVPDNHNLTFKSVGGGFDGQVALAAEAAQRRVERLLMFQDPLDLLEHLPEAHAIIRNCTLAGVALNINAGASYFDGHF